MVCHVGRFRRQRWFPSICVLVLMRSSFQSSFKSIRGLHLPDLLRASPTSGIFLRRPVHPWRKSWIRGCLLLDGDDTSTWMLTLRLAGDVISTVASSDGTLSAGMFLRSHSQHVRCLISKSALVEPSNYQPSLPSSLTNGSRAESFPLLSCQLVRDQLITERDPKGHEIANDWLATVFGTTIRAALDRFCSCMFMVRR